MFYTAWRLPEFSSKQVEFPQIKFHHPSSNNFVYINGQKFPSLPRNDKGRTCSFHKDLPEFITSQYTAFSYTRKEEKCILCKNFKLGSDSRDVHVRSSDRRSSRGQDNGLHGSKVLPLKVHTAVTYTTDHGAYPRRGWSTSPVTRAGTRTAPSSTRTAPSNTRTIPNSTRTLSRLSQPGHSNARDCTTRMSWSPTSRLPTRERPIKQSNLMSSNECLSECLSATIPPLNKEETLPICPKYKFEARPICQETLPICRKYNSPVENLQPILRIDYLMGCMKSAMNPVYVQVV